MEKVDRPCEICGHSDHIVGVSASALGAFSFNFCGICLSMRAEPKWMVDATVELCGGLDKVNKHAILTYYDKDTDSYTDVREGLIPIEMKSGEQFKTRGAVVKHLAEKYPDHVPRVTVEE